MQVQVQVEKTSPIVRKLTIRVPAAEVTTRFTAGLREVQKTAKIKGFRPGQVPISMVQQYYGADLRHQLFHRLIDESFREAVRQEQLRAIGSPKIETPNHQTGNGEHDHSLKENEDLTYTAEIEILPELEAKNYKSIPLTREKLEVPADEHEKLVAGLLDSRAELLPVSGRAARRGDHVDLEFSGAVVHDDGRKEERAGMKGSRVIEIGSGSLIPGFEEHLEGMQGGEAKTFTVTFPADYHEKELASKPAEFSVKVGEVKEKKVPELSDDLAKELGYEDAGDLRKKAGEYLLKQRTDEQDRKLRSELVAALVERNPFDCPAALIDAQAQALAQDVAQDLKRQGFADEMIRDSLVGELPNLKTRAESQVRASLILDAIAKQEKVEPSPEEFETELKRMAQSMRTEEGKLREYYNREPAKREDFLFRIRQDKTMSLLMDQAKIKTK